MDKLIALLIQFLPKQIEWIKILQFVPDAAATVKEMIAYVDRTIETLKQENVLTPQQDAELDAMIELKSKLDYWQPDERVNEE